MEVSANNPYQGSKSLQYGVQAITGGDVRLAAAKAGIASQKFSYIASLSCNFGKTGSTGDMEGYLLSIQAL